MDECKGRNGNGTPKSTYYLGYPKPTIYSLYKFIFDASYYVKVTSQFLLNPSGNQGCIIGFATASWPSTVGP